MTNFVIETVLTAFTVVVVVGLIITEKIWQKYSMFGRLHNQLMQPPRHSESTMTVKEGLKSLNELTSTVNQGNNVDWGAIWRDIRTGRFWK